LREDRSAAAREKAHYADRIREWTKEKAQLVEHREQQLADLAESWQETADMVVADAQLELMSLINRMHEEALRKK